MNDITFKLIFIAFELIFIASCIIWLVRIADRFMDIKKEQLRLEQEKLYFFKWVANRIFNNDIEAENDDETEEVGDDT